MEMMGVQEVDKVDVNGYGFRVVHLMVDGRSCECHADVPHRLQKDAVFMGCRRD